ncbi:hypothetical protein GPJ56_006020 [Histomonas meleagridis]|uniref:uncharacterized protein n=1 Tax=Histomonas meleagridis TaxID=135588 RepID=UPI003559F722|nr:hypothetical protein GPJ56_006020 [Histomonas meleagridis]KAH0799427.1 hypothetical protein GO595_007828 [Histomonas meleagridis]
MSLNIGEKDPTTNSLVSMEMQDTQKIGFRRRNQKRKSIDKIFSKIDKCDVSEVDRSILRGLPRRSLANDLDLTSFRNGNESDEEEEKDSKSVKMLDLKIGEQNPMTNSLVALEMQDTHKIGFKKRNKRRKSIDKIFEKFDDVHINNVEKSKLSNIPRRSLADNDIKQIRNFHSESDDENDDPNSNVKVQMLDLNIGETDPTAKSLVALEMKDTKRTGFKRSPQRRKSIDRIFSKVKSVNVDCEVDESILKKVPRRSLANDFDVSSFRTQNKESDSE